MALIKCSDCKNEISDQAEKCLHCGKLKDSTIAARSAIKGIIKIGAGFGSVLVGFMSIGLMILMFTVGSPLLGIVVGTVAFFGLRFLWKFINNL